MCFFTESSLFPPPTDCKCIRRIFLFVVELHPAIFKLSKQGALSPVPVVPLIVCSAISSAFGFSLSYHHILHKAKLAASTLNRKVA